MSRIYAVDYATPDEGDTLDAGMIREGVFDTLEATTEEARWDGCCIPSGKETCTGTWYSLPAMVEMRRDRDGAWRAINIDPLAAGGSVGQTLYCYLLDSMRLPDASHDDKTSWDIGASTYTAWQGGKNLRPGRDRRFSSKRFAGTVDDDQPETFFGWLVFTWGSTTGSPSFAGFRAHEVVDVS